MVQLGFGAGVLDRAMLKAVKMKTKDRILANGLVNLWNSIQPWNLRIETQSDD